MKMKYALRRVTAAIVIIAVLTIFTSVIIRKGTDALIEQDRIMWEEHKQTWGIEL